LPAICTASPREKGLNHDGKHAPLVLGTLCFTLAVLWLIDGGAGACAARSGAAALGGGGAACARAFFPGSTLSVDAYRVLADLVLILPLPLAWL
jgi:hypothetical protein